MTETFERARGLRRRGAAALGIGALLYGGVASANGRFPRAQRLLEDPADAAHLILGATYGLVVTSDRGNTWHYVCEAAYGERELTVDALTALTPEGALLAGIYSGVSRAAQSPCDFKRTLGMNNREAVPDFALATSRPGEVVAIMVALPESGGPENYLYRSRDDGKSWQKVSELPKALRVPLTIELSESDAERIYLSGLGADDAGVLLRSDDAGASFQVTTIPTNAKLGEFPYIAAVDGEHADQIYVRTDLWAYHPDEGVAYADDALLYSDDGGAAFSELIRQRGKLYGFAFSPDRQQLLLGYGDPFEFGGQRVIDPGVLGIYRAPKGSSAFEKVYAGSIGCLTWSAEGVYACTPESETGFSLGLSRSSDFDLTHPAKFEARLSLKDVAGPLACDACSAAAVCENFWFSTCQSWGRSDCQELEAGSCGSGGTGASGSAGLVSEASGGEAPVAGSGNGLNPSAVTARGGCACRSAGHGQIGGVWLALGGLGGLWRARRHYRGARAAVSGAPRGKQQAGKG